MANEGSRRQGRGLVAAGPGRGPDGLRRQPAADPGRHRGQGSQGPRPTLPPEQVERRRQTAIQLDLGRNLRPRPNGRPWTAEELAALGTAPDTELAQRFGRTETAVRVQRDRLGIGRAPGDNERRPWEA